MRIKSGRPRICDILNYPYKPAHPLKLLMLMVMTMLMTMMMTMMMLMMLMLMLSPPFKIQDEASGHGGHG